MDDRAFDEAVKRFGPTSRRSILGALALPASGLLGGSAVAQSGPSAARCLKYHKKCGKGTKCCTGMKCSKKKCVCKTGEYCGKACADVATDTANCGRCGNVCPDGAVCSAGSCACNQTACPLRSWGSYDDPVLYLGDVYGVAVASNGDVYVADNDNNIVAQFTSKGDLIRQWGTLGTNDGEFNSPTGIAVDSSQNVYVIDSDNERVQKFTATGQFVRSWKAHTGDFNASYGIAVSPSGSIYVTSMNYDIQVFSSDGDYIKTIDTTAMSRYPTPAGIAFDKDGNFYVADTYNNAIAFFTSQDGGIYVRSFGQLGTLDGRLDTPYYLTVGPDGNVYVSDERNDRVQVFSPSGDFIAKWDEDYPEGIAFGPDGTVYVGSSGIRQYELGPPLA